MLNEELADNPGSTGRHDWHRQSADHGSNPRQARLVMRRWAANRVSIACALSAALRATKNAQAFFPHLLETPVACPATAQIHCNYGNC
jgi:hypothetical protein